MTLPLIVLRPQPAAAATMARAAALGLSARSVPLFSLKPVRWSVPDPRAYDALLLTSAAAPCLAGAQLADLRALPAHCVGTATAAVAREAGLPIAQVGTADGQALIDSIGPRRLLWLAGQHRSPLHAAPGGTIDAVTVYAAQSLDADPFALAGPAVIVVHSARAGDRLAQLAADKARQHLVAISTAVARACGAGWAGVHVAPSPDDAAMVAIAADLCQSVGQSGPAEQVR